MNKFYLRATDGAVPSVKFDFFASFLRQGKNEGLRQDRK